MTRIAMWFGSLLLSVVSFSLLFIRDGSTLVIFRVTMTIALPVACLYLPFVIALKDAEKARIWTILLSGILIGPASMGLLFLIAQLRGGDPLAIWRGDPLTGVGGNVAIFCALIVGLLTTSIYVIALKGFRGRSTRA